MPVTAVTELPLSLASSYGNYVAASSHLRTSWLNSFYIPPIANSIVAEVRTGFGDPAGFNPGLGFVQLNNGSTAMRLALSGRAAPSLHTTSNSTCRTAVRLPSLS
jgi:hypothetical protein